MVVRPDSARWMGPFPTQGQISFFCTLMGPFRRKQDLYLDHRAKFVINSPIATIERTSAMTQTTAAEACHAYVLNRVRETTKQLDEPAADAALRHAVIMAMFLALAPANAMQASMACHCIELEFALSTAMREAGNPALEGKPMAAARAYAMSASRNWHRWVSKYQKTQALDAAAAAKQTALIPPALNIGPSRTAPAIVMAHEGGPSMPLFSVGKAADGRPSPAETRVAAGASTSRAAGMTAAAVKPAAVAPVKQAPAAPGPAAVTRLTPPVPQGLAIHRPPAPPVAISAKGRLAASAAPSAMFATNVAAAIRDGIVSIR